MEHWVIIGLLALPVLPWMFHGASQAAIMDSQLMERRDILWAAFQVRDCKCNYDNYTHIVTHTYIYIYIYIICMCINIYIYIICMYIYI